MTTYDFWVTDLDSSSGPDLSRGGRDQLAHRLGWTLWEFFGDGRATADPKQCHNAHFRTVVTGDVLAEVFRATERSEKHVFRQPDRTLSVDAIEPTHQYEITFIEH